MKSDAKVIMDSSTANWILIIAGPTVVGILFALRFRRRTALILSGAVPWLTFLAFNLHSEFYPSGDDLLLKGAWPVFQAVFGSMVAIVGMAVCWLTFAIRRD